jgi:GNAT superfamily N-acetyltransferase
VHAGDRANVQDPLVTIRELRDDERAFANAQYRAIAFAESPPASYGVIAEIDGERVGLGRLVELEPGVFELGGIWTSEAVRGRGVARAIVTALLDAAREREIERLWCIPFAHLEAFYVSCGFATAPGPWPATIDAKVADCIAKQLAATVVLTR